MLTLTWHHSAAVFSWLQEDSAVCVELCQQVGRAPESSTARHIRKTDVEVVKRNQLNVIFYLAPYN